jgi:predicted Fe-Mo cluster-binding NifX family protein
MPISAIRVAVASSDGKFVSRHFGHADKFYIVDVTPEGFHCVCLRHCVPVCNMGEHNEADAESALSVLSDCDCVLVSRIGPDMREFLQGRGLRPYEIAGFVSESLAEVFRRERNRI